jgi:hypothetical protein
MIMQLIRISQKFIHRQRLKMTGKWATPPPPPKEEIHGNVITQYYVCVEQTTD